MMALEAPVGQFIHLDRIRYDVADTAGVRGIPQGQIGLYPPDVEKEMLAEDLDLVELDQVVELGSGLFYADDDLLLHLLVGVFVCGEIEVDPSRVHQDDFIIAVRGFDKPACAEPFEYFSALRVFLHGNQGGLDLFLEGCLYPFFQGQTVFGERGGPIENEDFPRNPGIGGGEPVHHGVFTGTYIRLAVQHVPDHILVRPREVDLPEIGFGSGYAVSMQVDQGKEISGCGRPRHEGKYFSLHVPDRPDAAVPPHQDYSVVGGLPGGVLGPGEHLQIKLRMGQRVGEAPEECPVQPERFEVVDEVSVEREDLKLDPDSDLPSEVFRQGFVSFQLMEDVLLGDEPDEERFSLRRHIRGRRIARLGAAHSHSGTH